MRKAPKTALTQAGETAAKVSAFGGGVCAIGLDPASAVTLLPIAAASVQSIQESAV